MSNSPSHSSALAFQAGTANYFILMDSDERKNKLALPNLQPTFEAVRAFDPISRLRARPRYGEINGEIVDSQQLLKKQESWRTLNKLDCCWILDKDFNISDIFYKIQNLN